MSHRGTAAANQNLSLLIVFPLCVTSSFGLAGRCKQRANSVLFCRTLWIMNSPRVGVTWDYVPVVFSEQQTPHLMLGAPDRRLLPCEVSPSRTRQPQLRPK